MKDEIVDHAGRKGVRAPEKLYMTGLARRRPRLAGARVGLLENPTCNADRLLDSIGHLLVTEYGAAATTLRQRKACLALSVSDAVVAQYRATCDVVIVGVGDCGPSSASAVADGMLLEQAGLPTAVICTEAFIATADAMAELRGAPDYDYVVTEHPVVSLTPEQVRERGRRLLSEVVSLLMEESDE